MQVSKIETKRHVGMEIKALSNLIKRQIDERVMQSDVRLTGMQCWIIGYLNKHANTKDVFQRDIEAEFHIRRSTATGILQLMEKNGLITREPVSYDARLKKLVMTPKAKEICLRIKHEIAQIEAKLTNGLTREETESFFAIIDKVKKNIE